MTFTPSHKHNPCPICEDTSGDCRHLDNGLILCHDFPDSDAGVSGWRWLKRTDKGAMWGVFVPDDGKDFDPEEWQRQKAERKARQRREQEHRAAGALPIPDRDKAIRKLHKHIGLSTDHRQKLRSRGLTDAQIDASYFFSIYPGQELPPGIPTNLPGVDFSGGRLWTRGSGFACPAFDVKGRIIGWQTRFDNPGTEGKYRWPRGQQSSHLPNGELPITVCRPIEGVKRHGVGLAEGLLKPYISAQKLGQIFIGAAGGNFASSPSQLKEAMDKIAPELVILYPDAGAVLNPQVMRQYHHTYVLLEKWGYTVKFAWWGQTTKDCADIDELSDFSSITYLSPKQFFNICKQALKEKQQAEKEEKAFQEQAIAATQFRSLSSISEVPFKVLHERYLDLKKECADKGKIYIVVSAMGTGKTEAITPIVRESARVYACFNRVALGRESCNRIGVTYKDDAVSFGGKNKRGFCADSAHQFNPSILGENGLFLMDEADQVFCHIFGDTCNKDGKRPSIIKSIEADIKSATLGGGRTILMSATITQKEIDLVKAIAPEGVEVRLILNTYKPKRGKLLFHLADDNSGMIQALIEKLKEGIPCFVVTDIKNGKKGCKTLAEHIRENFPEWESEVVEINSDTSGSKEIIEFLKNINTASLNKRLIICSPSVTSGISITNGRFNHGVFGFFNGVLNVNDAMQALARVRGAEEINVWAAKKAIFSNEKLPTDVNEIRRKQSENYQMNYPLIHSLNCEYEPLTQEWDSPWFDLWCKNTAFDNLCRNDLRRLLLEKLQEEGYSVETVASAKDEALNNTLKETWGKIEVEEAIAISNAKLLDDIALEAMQLCNDPLSPEEQLNWKKTMLLKWFGQALIDTIVFKHKITGETLTGFAAMALKNSHDAYRKRLENFRLLQSELSEAIARDIAAEQAQLKHGNGRFAGDIKWNARQRKCREWLGLKNFLDPEKNCEDKDFWELAQKAKSRCSEVKDTLNISVQKIANAQIYVGLLNQLGLDIDVKQQTSRETGKLKRVRKISEESWRYACLYKEYKDSQKADREGDKVVVPQPNQPQQQPKLDDDHVVAEASAEQMIAVINLPSKLETLVLDPAFCTSVEDLVEVSEGVQDELIEKAIVFQDTQQKREQTIQPKWGISQKQAESFGFLYEWVNSPYTWKILKVRTGIASLYNREVCQTPIKAPLEELRVHKQYATLV